ncbi:DUF2142 domain-containing protein [Candidatus Roizmanbacteria bacterium]|nr:DUF2142 domain-containing protein [Candidatus Roizmanbacteria bacterium]
MVRHLKLYLIVLAYLIYFIISPPFQTPDEPEHYQIVYFLTRLQYPRLVRDVHTSTNYQLLGAFEKVFNTTQVASENYVLPDFEKIKKFVSQKNKAVDFPKVNNPLSKQGHQPIFYHAVAAAFFSVSTLLHLDMITQYYVVRLASSFFYFISVYLAYLILKYLFKKTDVAENLTVFFAINPVTLKAGIAVNPDSALLFFSLLALYLVLKMKEEISPKFILVYSFTSGFAMWTKFQGVALVPFFVFIIFQKYKWTRKSIWYCVLYLGMTFLIISPWFLLNLTRYGQPVIDNFAIMGKFNLPHYNLGQAIIQAILEFRHTVMHYAGFWGWGEPYPFKIFFITYTILFIFFSFVGIVQIFKEKNNQDTTLLAHSFSLILFLFSVALRHKLLRFSGDIQGRYLLPAFIVFVIYLVKGAAGFSKIRVDLVSKYFLWFSLFQYYFILFFIIIPKYYV